MNSHEKISFWNSLVVRFGLMFTGLVLTCVLVAGYLVFNQASELIIENSKTKVAHDAQLAQQSFFNLLNEVSNDIAVVTNNSSILRYIKEPSIDNSKDVSALAHVFLKNKPGYYQLRIINAADGMEKLRFDKKTDQRIYESSVSQLQEKKNREYFINAIANSDIDYYFSEINLNEEYGKVSIPHIPTLRAVGKIRDEEGQLEALLVININLTFFFDRLENIMESASKISITDEHGQYLFDEDSTRRFGDQLGIDITFPKDHTFEWNNLPELVGQTVSLLDREGIEYVCQIDKLSYSSDLHSIYMFTMVDLDMLLSEAKVVRNKSLRTIMIICGIALLFIFLFTRFLSNRINLITRAVTDFESNNTISLDRISIPDKRKDEVGLLARSFSKMKVRLAEQMLELKEGLKREKQAIKIKDEFLQNMSHDLRTPLNAILGLTQLIRKNKPSKELEPIIDSLHRSATNLSVLMSDVLDQHKLMEGKVSLKPQPSNIYQLIYDIYASYQYEAVNKGLRVHFECDEELKNQQFMIDPLRFIQIITNLLVNAIKYTSRGEVSLTAGLIQTDKMKLVVKIKDTGVGISQDKITQINNRFYQAHQDSTLITDGFGLGLSIVKQLLTLFNGDLIVISTPNTGSEFTVQIPVLPANISESNDEKVTSTGFPSLEKKYKILHIEDDDASLLMIRDILTLENFSVSQVKSADEAFSLLSKKKFDLVVTDIMLKSGKLNPEDLFQLGNLANTYLLILSALEKEYLAELSPDYLQKPIDLNQLLDKVFRLVGKYEFGTPYLDDIKIQYDQDQSKIVNYMEILIHEFEAYIKRIDQLKINFEEQEWESITHKLITHVKAMKLTQTEPLLEFGIGNGEEEKFDILINQLRYYLCCFRDEKRLISEI